MTRFRVTITIETFLSKGKVESRLSQVLREKGMDLERIQIKEIQPLGRPMEYSPRLMAWIERRRKPFTAETFANFMGMSYIAAYQKLQRLVRAGVMTKEKRAGSVEYSVIRIDEL